MVWNDLALILAVFGILLTLYIDVYIPWRTPKSKIEYNADHYFITENLATHDYMIKNEGDAPSKQIGLYLALKPPYKIQSIHTSPQFDKKEGGEQFSHVELTWDKLSPHNFITARIVSDGDKEKPESVFPMEFKVWDEKSIIGKYEFRNI